MNSTQKTVNKKLSIKEKKEKIKNENKNKKQQGFFSFLFDKVPSSFVILFFVLLFVMFLTWVIPGEFDFNSLFPGYADFYDTYDSGSLLPYAIDGNTTISELLEFIDSGSSSGVLDYSLKNTLESMIGITPEPGATSTFSVISYDTTVDELNNIWNLNPYVQSYNPQGILNVFYSITYGFMDALPIILYIFVLGGFLEIVMETGSMEKGTFILLKKFKGKEIYIIPILFFLFSLGGSTFGMQEESIGFFIIVVPILIMAGFDAVTGMIVIVLGTTTGMVASTVNPFSIGVATEAIDAVSIGDGIGFRWVYWLVFTTMGAMYVTHYARKVKKNPELSVQSKEDRDELSVWAKSTSYESSDKLTNKEKSTLIIFALSFVTMIFFIMPWYEWVPEMAQVPQVGWHWYSWLVGATPTTGDFPYTGLGGPGSWYFMEIIALFLVATLIISAINWKGEKHLIETFLSGAKGMMSVAFIIAVSRGIPVMMSWSGIDTFMITGLTSLASGLSDLGFIIIAYIIFLVLSLFIPSTSGLAGATMPLMGSTAVGIGGKSLAVATVNSYTIASGAVNMITPVQGVLMAQAETSRVGYKDYLKVATPYFLAVVALGIPTVMISTVATF